MKRGPAGIAYSVHTLNMSLELARPTIASTGGLKISSDIENTFPDPVLLASASEEYEFKSFRMDTGPNIAPNLAPPKKTIKRDAPIFTSTNRGRIVSLDRDMVGLDIAMKVAVNTAESNLDDNSTVTSDGESSYFAKDLPSPKSGRHYPFSDAASASSAPARAGMYPSASYRESDASLSFSDDDDEEDVRHSKRGIHARSPLLPPPVPRGDGHITDGLPIYHQRVITRMHSASSLVSSNSGGDTGQGMTNHGPGLLVDDDESDAELQELYPQSRISTAMGDRPSGRNPPESFVSPSIESPINPQSSPPTIFAHGYPDRKALAYPQPQLFGPDQTSLWMTAGNAASHQWTQQIHPHITGYGATFVAPSNQNQPPSLKSRGAPNSENSIETATGSRGSRSHGTLPMVYSDDDDTDEGVPILRVASGNRQMLMSSIRGARAFEDNLRVSEKTFHHDIHGVDGGIDGMGVTTETAFIGQVPSAFQYNTDSDFMEPTAKPHKDFLVYWQRWLMLFLMSALNLLSDWTCYSVAPIAMLTSEAFGKIDPEQLVVVFLGANVVATACEPIILSRLGLRRTVVFGSLLLMTGSVIKSGGFPPIIASNLKQGHGEWRVYLGFFLVGLSQPLYQCTPALLSASWFPERERTLATGVALNANQLGIGFAFIFGTLLVSSSDDIVPYFGLLSILSTVGFIWTLLFFDDAPPTPPSDTSRVIRGTFEWQIPNADFLWKSVQSLGANSNRGSSPSLSEGKVVESLRSNDRGLSKRLHANDYSSRIERPKERVSADRKTASTARRRSGTRGHTHTTMADIRVRGSIPSSPPSAASTDQPVELQMDYWEDEALDLLLPSAMMAGDVGQEGTLSDTGNDPLAHYENFGGIQQNRNSDSHDPHVINQSYAFHPQGIPMYQFHSQDTPQNLRRDGSLPPTWQPQFQSQYQDPFYQTYQFYGQPSQHTSLPFSPQSPQGYYYYSQENSYFPQVCPPQYSSMYLSEWNDGPPSGIFDDGTEPTLTITDHHLDINIRDDQVILSIRACFSRPGFIHALVAFTASGIVINTLSTFMDYLVRLNGAGREYVGIVGGSFQFVIMISSLIIGKQTDKTRAYYSVTIGMLVLGAFGLAECGVCLDTNRGGDLRWSLIMVACLVGPLQPVSTELGVEVAYPLSENTVLVIQQLFSNLLSALFIPFFKALKDIGTERMDASELYERPRYTFSFYLLIVIHAAVTVFFATFNGRYLRYEDEVAKKDKEESERRFHKNNSNLVQGNSHNGRFDGSGLTGELPHLNDEVLYPNERRHLMAGYSRTLSSENEAR